MALIASDCGARSDIKLPSDISPEATDLLGSILIPNPAERPSAEMIMQHPVSPARPTRAHAHPHTPSTNSRRRKRSGAVRE